MMKSLSFGEILFDCYPTSERIGGAPFNSSAHIAALGGDACVVSAVGDDELGKRALEELKRLGVSSDFVKVSRHPTGRADITLDSDGNADYEFNDPCSWDDITVSPENLERILSEEWDVFVFGTLAARSATSMKTLMLLLGNIKARHIFFDVNFRKDLWTPELVREGMRKATILKMNEEELPLVLELSGCTDVRSLMKAYELEYVLLTLGENGSVLYSCDKFIHQDIVPGSVVDTVGAGDSLSAAFLFFLLKGEKEETALFKASTVASFVVSNEGAVPEYPEELRRSLLL